MRRRIRTSSRCVLLIVALFATAGPTAVASAPARVLDIELEPSSLLTPTHVTYEWTARGLEVRGRIEKRRARYGRILGHAEIDLLDKQGRLLSRHTGALQQFSPRRKDPDWASFRAHIETVPTDAARLRIHHAVGARP